MTNKHITFQNSVVLTDVALIRNLNGVRGDVAEVASAQVHGSYWFDITDTTTGDDNRTCIVAIDGGRWKLVVIDADAVEYQPGSASAYRDGSVGAALAGLEHEAGVVDAEIATLNSAVFSSGGLEDTLAATQDNLTTYKAAVASPTNGSGADRVGGVGRVVNTIADLKALLKTGVGRAFVLGYYAATDGGGGQYWYDSTDTTSADNGSTIIVASDGGRWKLQYTTAVSIKQGGCKIDGATDDTTALQALVTAAGTLGFELYHPGGTCLITGVTSTLARLVVRGAGYNAIFKITGAAGSFGFKFISPSGSGTHFGSGARLYDLQITCAATANQIYGVWCANAEIDGMERVYIDLSANTFAGTARNGTYAFLGDYQQDGSFYQCHFTSGSGVFADGVFLTGNLAGNRKPNNNTFIACRAQSCGGYGVRNSIGDGNVWFGGKIQGNAGGGWLEADDGFANGPSNTTIRACGFEINLNDDLHADVTNHLVVDDVVFQSVGATNHINITFGTGCRLDRCYSFPAKPVNIAGGSNNLWDVRNTGFGALTFAAATMGAMGSKRVALTDAATVATDCGLGNYFTLTGTTARTMGAPTNPADGELYTYELENTSGGAITHTWNAIFRVVGWGAIPAGLVGTIQFRYSAARFKFMQVGAPALGL